MRILCPKPSSRRTPALGFVAYHGYYSSALKLVFFAQTTAAAYIDPNAFVYGYTPVRRDS